MFLASSTAALAACPEIFNLQRELSQKRFLNNLAISLRLLLVPSRVLFMQGETTPDWLGYFCVAAGWVGEKMQPVEYRALLKIWLLVNTHSRIRYPTSKLLSVENKSFSLAENKKICKRNKMIINRRKPQPWGAAQHWMKGIASCFTCFSCLPSLCCHWLFRCLQGWNRGGKAACQVLKFLFEGPFFRWKKELQTELPNPNSTFKVWLILCQSGICHLRHEALLNTQIRSLPSYLPLKA